MSVREAFYHHTKSFQFLTTDNEVSVCGLDIFARLDQPKDLHWALILVTQRDEEKAHINVNIGAIVQAVYERIILPSPLLQILTPDKVLVVEDYPVNQSSRYRRMERVTFRAMGICVHRQSASFGDAIWHRIHQESIERLMGTTWDRMGLPEVKRYVG